SLIGTVRNVGYRFVTPEKPERSAEEPKASSGRAKPVDTDTAAALDATELRADA
ncbi:DNA-binding response regulator, partial [Streptomyces nigra]